MLVKQNHCQPQSIISAAPHNRFLSPDWKIQESIERQFAQARKAWVRYQSTRQRDAIYGYLSVVFEIVQRWKMFGNVKAYSVHALTDANRRGKTRSRDPYSITIFCTSDSRIVDAKTRSKWSKALQFAARTKPAGQPVGTFMKSQGGINECSMS